MSTLIFVLLLQFLGFYYQLVIADSPITDGGSGLFSDHTNKSIHGLPFKMNLSTKDSMDIVYNNSMFKQSNVAWVAANDSTTTYVEDNILSNISDHQRMTIRCSSVQDGLQKRSVSNLQGRTLPSIRKNKLRKIGFKINTLLFNVIGWVATFIAGIFRAMISIIGYMTKNNQEMNCTSDTIWVTQRNGGDWQETISIFTKGGNCNTIITEDEIRCALEETISDEEFYYQMAFCVRVEQGDLWHAVVRFQRNWDPPFSNIWHMKCPPEDTKTYFYKPCSFVED